ncbi:carboxypeptidase-like regulatory domain-containing protein, partial [Streptomyces misionensis]|uniref:carboxypeptidase-like regulatory domain-containing protein n=1 Tax=Streptomyces misionensis TaxID=67331 RepID=UPI00367538F1
THAFNAMPGIHHRAPGPVMAAIDNPDVTLELILDGLHVHPTVAALLVREAPGRVALVTVLGPGGRRLVSTLTDARGEYAVTGLPEGYLSVVAAVPGRQPAVRQTLLGSGEVVRADFLLRDRPGAVPAGGPARD